MAVCGSPAGRSRIPRRRAVASGYTGSLAAPISVGTYVRAILQVRRDFGGDERTLLVGHDWGANAGYGAVACAPGDFRQFVALAVPPTAALGTGIFEYRQLRRSFYIWFIQQVGLAEWRWCNRVSGSPCGRIGLRATARRRYRRVEAARDGGQHRGRHKPVSRLVQPGFRRFVSRSRSSSTMTPPPVATLCLHGVRDGAIGAGFLADVAAHLPASGSAFGWSTAWGISCISRIPTGYGCRSKNGCMASWPPSRCGAVDGGALAPGLPRGVTRRGIDPGLLRRVRSGSSQCGQRHLRAISLCSPGMILAIDRCSVGMVRFI